MIDIFKLTERPNSKLFHRKPDANDARLGEIVSNNTSDYDAGEIVILGYPNDEGVARNNGRIGASLAPDVIRTQFYKLTTFGITTKILDLGDTINAATLEETHDARTEIVKQILLDGKKIISLGGGNDIAFPDCRALSQTIGAKNVTAINIDAHFDVRISETANSGTPYRQLLTEKFIEPQNFYEIGYQKQVNSEIYFNYLRDLKVNLIELEEVSNFEFQNLSVTKTDSLFWGIDVDAVRASDAPGVSAPNPDGLSAREFTKIARRAGRNPKTRIIEFSEMNPNFDVDNKTARLVAAAMHKFCAAVSEIKLN